jgi:hemoglobin
MPDTLEHWLCKLLGGYDAVVAAMDNLLRRLHNDPQLGGYRKGASRDSHRRDHQLIVDFMAEAAGGSPFILGAI